MSNSESALDVSTRVVPVTRVGRAEQSSSSDPVAVEEPLQVVVNGEPFAVIMRTPGHDRELAAGFLFAERVVRTRTEITGINVGIPLAPRLRVGGAERHNVVEVVLGVDAADRMRQSGRRVTTTSSCGLCGRQAIESLRVEAPRVASGCRVTRSALASFPDRLREAQRVFETTGGLHGAALFAVDGELADAAEDVGRHNAVDKVVGRQLLDGRLPLSDRLLFVSGRTSFEIVQKAFFAGIPVVAAVSAPSSLAIDLAADAGITLIGFVRNGGFNVYTSPERVI